jgi:lipoprotein signal peptidase
MPKNIDFSPQNKQKNVADPYIMYGIIILYIKELTFFN